MLDSSSVTAPFLLHKHTRSKGPSLRRHCPASSVIWPSPTLRLAAALSGVVRRRDLRPAPSLPHSLQIAFPACCSHYPGGPNQCSLVDELRVPAPVSSLSVQPSPFLRRVGVHNFTFEACSGFTRVTACKVAHPPSWALSRGSALAGFPARTLASYQVQPTTT